MALVDNAWYINFGDGSTTGYYGIAAWGAAASKVCGNIVRQLAAPAVNSERAFVCIASTAGAGQTGGAEPAWTLTRGAKNTDNTVTWQEATGIAALNGDLSNTPTWTTVKNTVVTLGQVIQNVAGTLILICSTGGTAGNGAEPSWAAYTAAGATTADNTATWTTLGASFAAWAAPHARGQNAFTSTWGQQGNIFFIGDNHAETQATLTTWLSPSSTVSLPCNVYCADHTKAPPGTGDLKTTAQVINTGNLATSIAVDQFFYFYGITWKAGTGANSAMISFGSTANKFCWIICENCAFTMGTSAVGTGINFGQTTPSSRSNGVYLINTTVTFAGTGQVINNNGSILTIRNMTLAGSVPSTLIVNLHTFGMTTLIASDLSSIGAGNTLFLCTTQTDHRGYLINCKLGAGVTVSSAIAGNGQTVDVIVSDSSNTNYVQQHYEYAGSLVQETTIVRTGGASDGTTRISWNMTTNANSLWLKPFNSFPIEVWNDTVGSPITVTVYGIWGGGAVPNNDDIWIEAEYLGLSTFPLGSFANDTKANNLAAGTALAADTSTWSGSTTKFSMSVTFTPQMKGPIVITVKAAKPSTTFYIDPKPSVTGLTFTKTAIFPPGIYINDFFAAAGAVVEWIIRARRRGKR